MVKTAVLQSSFVAGELSPHMFDRVDLEAYFAGAAYLRNFIPLTHGPIARRQGSQYLNKTPGFCRLVPFSFSVSQSFMLEFSAHLLRVYYQDTIVLNAAGNAPFSIATQFREEDLPNLSWAQYKDWLYVCDGYHPPVAIKRYANNDWRQEDLVFTNIPVEWGGTNWPAFVTFFEQRAVYAAAPADPQQIWMSRTGLPEDFTYNDGTDSNGQLIVLDDHALTYTIFSTDANGIKWVVPGSALLIGTSGSEYRVGSTVFGDAITPKNIKVVPQTTFGSAPVTPVKADASIIFVPRSRTRVRSIEYSIQQEQFLTQDLTVFSSHIALAGIKEMASQTAPDTYLWMVTEAGELIGCTYEKSQKVIAWHKHVTDGEYVSIGVSPSDGNDFIYVIVKRGDEYFTELFTNLTEPPSDINEAWYVDSGLKYEGPPIQHIVGMSHLANKKINVLVDGWVHPQVTVAADGSFDLDQPGSKIQAGLPYTSTFTSLAPQSQQSLTVGMKRRINEFLIALEDSLDFYYRTVSQTKLQLEYFGPTRIMNKAKVPGSRQERLPADSSSDYTEQLQVWTDRPVPMVVRTLLYFINPAGI